MKKNYLIKGALTVTLALFGLNSFGQTYCSQQATSTADDEIFNVTLGTLNNSSTCGMVGGPGSIAYMYQNYTALTPPILTAGTTQTISVTGGQCNTGAYSGVIYVWIDYNQNGSFTDPGEQVWTTTGLFAIAGTVYTGTFTIPLAPTFGVTRMRVTLIEGTTANPGPCTNFTWGEVEDYNVNVIANTPCSGTPASNVIVPATYSTCPGLNNPSMSLSTQYTVGGITYQWYSSTVSNVGPFTAVTGATLQSSPVPTLATTTWYQAVVTCTNSNQSTTTTANTYFVDGAVVDNVPYFEGFENIQGPNRLPNCSWSATSINGVTQTYTASASNNRLPFQGAKFAAFSNATPGTNYFYSNGIQMEPGITYSVGLMYATEYFGYTNWSDLGVYIGNNQTPAAMNLVASTAPAVSGPHKELGGTFTVPSSGVYYVGVRAVGTAGSAPYLSWDNLSVTIPCTPLSGNNPTVSLSATNQTVCAGELLGLNATGADAYTWSNGGTGASISTNPTGNITYSVTGTNTLTGCTDVQSVAILVNPSPNVNAFASAPEICPGETSYLSAVGANSYAWSNGANGQVISVTPGSTTSYTVIGTNMYGCSATDAIAVTVKSAPTINANNANGATSCKGEMVTINATGGVSYQWLSSTSPNLYSGSSINVVLTTSTNFTVVGTGANGCNANANFAQNVEDCTGLNTIDAAVTGISVYPNPTKDVLTVSTKSGLISNVQILDVTGRVVLSNEVEGTTATFDMSALANGMYYVKVTAGENQAVLHVIKH